MLALGKNQKTEDRAKKAIIIFTRVPQPGQTKTRMMPYLSEKECARLHICFLQDIAARVHGLGKIEKIEKEVDLLVCHTPEDTKGILRRIFGEQATYLLQEGQDLGERMYNAIASLDFSVYDSCILIGTDVPEIRAQDFETGFRLLDEGKDIVFGPTKDGGYYLVGMKTGIKAVFEKQTYGHGKVLENTVEGLKGRGYSVGFTNTLQDMDERQDLQDYRNRMRLEEQNLWGKSNLLRNSRTGQFLAKKATISMIVPVYNEESTVEKLMEQLQPLKSQCEILFVDGGSKDRTLELIGTRFRVLHSEKGRANQMNLGARNSSGDILFFLHSDSELPKDPLREIRQVMKKHRAGCFGIAFHSKQFFMWTCRVISNHRVKDRKVMFGDQGIFIDRDLFFEIGMFPNLPIMEDYQLSLTLKEKGVRLGMTKHRIYTSDRRFPKKLVPQLRVMWKMNRLRKMYRDGVDIETISEMYRDVR